MFIFGLTKVLPISFGPFTSTPLSEHNPNQILALFCFGSTDSNKQAFCFYLDLAFNILDHRLFFDPGDREFLHTCRAVILQLCLFLCDSSQLFWFKILYDLCIHPENIAQSVFRSVMTIHEILIGERFIRNSSAVSSCTCKEQIFSIW